MTSQKRLEDYTEIELLLGYSLSRKEKQDIADLLERSLDRLICNGWCKGAYSCKIEGKECFCLHGAIRVELINDENYDLISNARLILTRRGYTVSWNDSCSSFHEVLRALVECIALVKKEL